MRLLRARPVPLSALPAYAASPVHSAAMRVLQPVSIVLAAGAALGLSFLAAFRLGPPHNASVYLVVNVLLCLTPALLLRVLTAREVTLLRVVVLVSTTVFCLLTMFLRHTGYFLAGPPPDLVTHFAVLASGLGWIAASLYLVGVVVRPGLSGSRPWAAARILLGLPFATRWLVLLALPFLVLWLSLPIAIGVVFVVALLVLVDALINAALVTTLRRLGSAPPPSVREALRELGRRTHEVEPQVVYLDSRWPPICQVRLRWPGAPLMILSQRALKQFTDTALQAVLAHEWAHVRFAHLQKMAAWDVGLGAATSFGLLGAARLVSVLPSREAIPLGIGLYLFVSLTARYFLLMHLSRRFERAADAFAEAAVGPDALREALECTSDDVPDVLTTFVAHDSIARRSRLVNRRDER